MAAKSVASVIIQRAGQQFLLARQGQRDITGPDMHRRRAGIYNAVVFGRSIEHILGRLKSADRKRFNEWIRPYHHELTTDPLLTWFKNTRDQMLKEGGSDLGVGIFLSSLSGTDMTRLMQNPPPGARGSMLGVPGTRGGPAGMSNFRMDQAVCITWICRLT